MYLTFYGGGSGCAVNSYSNCIDRHAKGKFEMANEPTKLRSISKNIEEGLCVGKNEILDFDLILLVDLFLGFGLY